MSETAAPVEKPLSKNEGLKAESRYLRGTLLAELNDRGTASISEEASQLLKFHGSYQQDDRDLRNERRRQKLDKAWIFMIRVRVPGGVCTPAQWLEIDRLSSQYANGTIKLTTRQAFQLHGILKGDLRQTVKEVNAALLDTLAACGDVNRNVMCSVNPLESRAHAAAYAAAAEISRHLSPQTKAYHEIWVNGELVEGADEDDTVEPLYGKTYLPRKFKTAVVVPPVNDVDLFTNDLGFIAVVEDGELVGYNVTAGGGMGMSHGQKQTFPRLADVLGYVPADRAVAAAEAVLTAQRDYGDRTERKHARLKYTIEDRGVEWFRGEVERRMGHPFEPARPFRFTTMSDRYGWSRNHDGTWHLGLFIQNGRVRDTAELPMRTGLRELAKIHTGDLRLTGNQNLTVSGITDAARPAIEEVLARHGLLESHRQTGLRLNSMACVALPTCGLSLAESERKLPELLPALEQALEEAGLRDDEITIRMTGCPNGCARPYNAEIGLVGRAPGKYNLYLGAAFDGSRLNKLFRETVPEAEVVEVLGDLFRRYAAERTEGERFGDWTIRAGLVKATLRGSEFHD